MSTNTKLFVTAGVLLGLALAVFVSPFASSSPDGLERVAEDEGFADSSTDHRLGDSPLADYGAEGVDDEELSIAASGLVGVLVTLGLATGVFALARRNRATPAEDASPGMDGSPRRSETTTA